MLWLRSTNTTNVRGGLGSNPHVLNTDYQFCNCIPGRKSGILRIQYGHAAAAAEISFRMR